MRESIFFLNQRYFCNLNVPFVFCKSFAQGAFHFLNCYPRLNSEMLCQRYRIDIFELDFARSINEMAPQYHIQCENNSTTQTSFPRSPPPSTHQISGYLPSRDVLLSQNKKEWPSILFTCQNTLKTDSFRQLFQIF